MSRLRTLLTLTALLAGTAVTRADELKTLGNKTITGTLVAVSDKEITMKTEAGMVTTPLSEVLSLDLRPVKGVPANYKYSDVKLLDDTVLHCSKVAFKGKKLELTLLSGQQATFPLDYVLWVLNDAHDANMQKEWYAILADKDVKRDRAVVYAKEVLNAIPGTFGDVDPKGEHIQFRQESGNIRDVAFTRLQGLIFYRTEQPSKSPVCLVHDVQGNSLAAVSVALKDNKLVVTTAGGIDVAYDQKLVARFDYNMGKLSFLSDLTPAKVVERSNVGLPIAFRRDVNLDGEPIVLADRPFTKGLSVHAHTELEYNLGGRFKEFRFYLGVDARTGAEGKAKVTIEVDGGALKTFEVDASTPVEMHTINLRGANRLRIIVSSTNLLDLHDHVTFADAQIRQ